MYNYIRPFHIPFKLLLHFEELGILDKKETNKYMLDKTGKYVPKFKNKKDNG